MKCNNGIRVLFNCIDFQLPPSVFGCLWNKKEGKETRIITDDSKRNLQVSYSCIEMNESRPARKLWQEALFQHPQPLIPKNNLQNQVSISQIVVGKITRFLPCSVFFFFWLRAWGVLDGPNNGRPPLSQIHI